MSLCIRSDTTCIRICWVGPSWVSLSQALIQINIFFPVCSLLQNPTKWPFYILTICCALFQWRSSLPLASRCQEEICPKSTTACSSTCTGEMAPAFRARSTRWTVFAVPWRCGTDALFIQVTWQPTIIGTPFFWRCASLHRQLHIVNIKSSLNLNTTAAVADSEGLAALGFLIEVRRINESSSLLRIQWVDLNGKIVELKPCLCL